MASRCKEVYDVMVEAGITIGIAFPIASNIITSIDRIMFLIQKATSNKALCEFIGERLNYAKSILKDSDNIDKKVLEKYSKVLSEIEDNMKVISGSKQGFKAWILAKRIISSK